MSSDNFYLIRNHPLGGYAAVMGFASNDHEPAARDGHRSFETVEAAVEYAHGEYSEYGVVIHKEVTLA